MLANGATLEYKKKGATEWVALPGLKEIPEIGTDPEKVDNTTLEDEVKQSENGIGDPGDVTYKFKYVNDGVNNTYRLMRELEKSGETATFKETLKDGTTTEFDAQVAVKRSGGGVNGAIEIDVAMSLQSKFTITDPA